METEVPRIRSVMTGRCSSGNGQIQLTGLQQHEVYEPLPTPDQEPFILEGWQGGIATSRMQVTECGPPQAHGFSLVIQHLCGYHNTPMNYTREIRKFADWGFVCCRSPRGKDGRFWELWFLPGDWMARGELRAAIEKANGESKIAAAVKFLCRNASFGTLDATVQRAAQVIVDDG